MVRGLRVMTSPTARGAQVAELLHGAAQVAVGEDAEPACRPRRARRPCPCRRASSPAAPSVPASSRRPRGTSVAGRMTSPTWVSSLRPSAPPGCERAKSSAPKPRASSSATASASPSASAAVVLAVGARLSGQASSSTRASRCDVGLARQRGIGVAGDGDQLAALALDQRHDGQQFVVLAGVGKRDQHVVARDHAQVAMHGFGGMHEIGRRAGAGHGGGDLARDVAGLADAADDDAAAAGQDQRHRLREARVQPIGERAARPRLRCAARGGPVPAVRSRADRHGLG